MTIAELFVNIGLKGADQTKAGLGKVEDGLGKVKTMSIEAKAAILAAVYGLEKMMRGSAETGQKLVNFAALTGLNTVELQRWQKVGEQYKVTNEEMEASVVKLQSAMAKMKLGKGAPEGYEVFVKSVKDFDKNRTEDPFYMLKKLQEYAQMQKTPEAMARANEFMSSMIGPNMIAAMRRNAYSPSNLAAVPVQSEGQSKQLAKVDQAWTKMWQKIEKMMADLVSQHGLKLIDDLSKMTTAFVKFVMALNTLADSWKLWDKISESMNDMARVISAVSSPGKTLHEMSPSYLAEEFKRKQALEKKNTNFKTPKSPQEESFLQTYIRHFMGKSFDDAYGGNKNPALPNTQAGAAGANNNVAITNNFNGNNGEHFEKTSKAVQTGTTEAFRMLDRGAVK